jgi:septal ring factor EnvC (AmiA/AmiB activator)
MEASTLNVLGAIARLRTQGDRYAQMRSEAIERRRDLEIEVKAVHRQIMSLEGQAKALTDRNNDETRRLVDVSTTLNTLEHQHMIELNKIDAYLKLSEEHKNSFVHLESVEFQKQSALFRVNMMDQLKANRKLKEELTSLKFEVITYFTQHFA